MRLTDTGSLLCWLQLQLPAAGATQFSSRLLLQKLFLWAGTRLTSLQKGSDHWLPPLQKGSDHWLPPLLPVLLRLQDIRLDLLECHRSAARPEQNRHELASACLRHTASFRPC